MPKIHVLVRAALAAAFGGFAIGAQADLPEKFDAAEFAKPSVCPGPWRVANAKCVLDTEQVIKLSEDSCTASKLTFNKAKSVCEGPSSADPAPECKAIPGYAPKPVGQGSDLKCTYSRTIPVSSPGDYIGDCIVVQVPPEGSGLTSSKRYFVSAQKNLEGNDRELTLVDGRLSLFPTFGCRADGGQRLHTASASALMKGGALRQGYAYGFLTMPYKYFPSSKSFTSTAPIGGYLGWRAGQAGSGFTTAFAMTISSVKANTVDPTKLDANNRPTVTGSADVAALSGAAGVMFDILKSGTGKPFKAGIFIGKDRVSTDPTVEYKFNRKTWIAIQLGYDFTDN